MYWLLKADRYPGAKVCDARMLHSSTMVWFKKKIQIIFDILPNTKASEINDSLAFEKC